METNISSSGELLDNQIFSQLLAKIKEEFSRRSNPLSGENLSTLIAWLPKDEDVDNNSGELITAEFANSILKAIQALSEKKTEENFIKKYDDIKDVVNKNDLIEVEIVNTKYKKLISMSNYEIDADKEHAGCEGACQGLCLNDCFSTCTERCSAECSNECADSCVKGCGGACSNECTKTCGLVCKNGCSSGCGSECEGGASMNYCNANACELNCDSGCLGKCGKYYCENGCAGTCSSSCSAKCDDKCVYGCAGSCISFCTGVAGFKIPS